MRTIKEMCEILGLSHRTFRYYDYIDLLKPAAYTDSGYRLYDDDSIRRIVKIRLLADVGYELSEVKLVLDDPDYDFQSSLEEKCTAAGRVKEKCEWQMALIERIRCDGLESVVEERLEDLCI